MSTQPLAPEIGTVTRWHVEETDHKGDWRLTDGDYMSRAMAFARRDDLTAIGKAYNLSHCRLRVVKTITTSEVIG